MAIQEVVGIKWAEARVYIFCLHKLVVYEYSPNVKTILCLSYDYLSALFVAAIPVYFFCTAPVT